MGRNPLGARRPVLHVLIGALFVTLLLPAACSGGDSSPAKSCVGGTDNCTHWNCTCVNGATFGASACINGACVDQSICDKNCEKAGGVASAVPAQSVKDSPECAAFCQRVADLGCGKCDPVFRCLVGPEECPDQKRAQLQCKADTGNFKCSGPNGWGETDNCPTADCPADAGDAGKDAAAD